ncbi:MAG: hypothetical protein H6767_07410 [Candidatus Peribacteria bacterium]|nr:MAG: hypothetical protein H6767_07410 [Candidatus Peribacteria bacterium]
MIYAIRNEGESNEKLILRYKKLFFQSRIASKIKSERYATRTVKKKKIRESAIVRSHYRKMNTKVYL